MPAGLFGEMPEAVLTSQIFIDKKPSYYGFANKTADLTAAGVFAKYAATRMPPGAPAILITQHMPDGFTRAFAERLNGLCAITVKEAEHGELVQPGHAYIAPGHSHMSIAGAGRFYRIALDQGAPVNRHRPAVDVLFNAVARVAGKRAIGVILTGMGADGARGLLEMKKAGALTVSQDEASCVVFGMPKVAIELGAVNEILPLTDIAAYLLTAADADKAAHAQ